MTRVNVCSNGCGRLVTNGIRDYHDEICELRKIACQHAGCKEMIKICDFDEHILECGERIVHCMNFLANNK